MHKFWLMMALCLLSNGVLAEWLEVERSEIQTTYADPAVVRSGWNRVQMSLLSDYKNPRKYEGRSFLSVIAQNEYKCKDRQTQVLGYSLHAGHMGEGEVIFSKADTGKWEAVAPGSMDEALWKIACDGKQ